MPNSPSGLPDGSRVAVMNMPLHTILLGSLIMFAGIVVDEKTLVPMGSALAVGTGVWWLGRKLQALEDGQASIQRRLDSLPCEKNGCSAHKKAG